MPLHYTNYREFMVHPETLGCASGTWSANDNPATPTDVWRFPWGTCLRIPGEVGAIIATGSLHSLGTHHGVLGDICNSLKQMLRLLSNNEVPQWRKLNTAIDCCFPYRFALRRHIMSRFIAHMARNAPLVHVTLEHTALVWGLVMAAVVNSWMLKKRDFMFQLRLHQHLWVAGVAEMVGEDVPGLQLMNGKFEVANKYQYLLLEEAAVREALMALYLTNMSSNRFVDPFRDFPLIHVAETEHYCTQIVEGKIRATDKFSEVDGMTRLEPSPLYKSLLHASIYTAFGSDLYAVVDRDIKRPPLVRSMIKSSDCFKASLGRNAAIADLNRAEATQ